MAVLTHWAGTISDRGQIPGGGAILPQTPDTISAMIHGLITPPPKKIKI